jgi:hypothetical protein
MLARTIVFAIGALAFADTAAAQQLKPVSDTTTTESGLRFVFLKRGTGPQPKAGDVMVIHGIGRFIDGREFWNTRTENAPYEYTPGVDRVIKGFEEGMKHVRAGDRIEIHMTPELAYGARGNGDIPPNSPLIFDYEILEVHPLSVARLVRAGIAASNVDSTLAAARTLPNLKDYYASEASVIAVANSATRADSANAAKVLAFGAELLPASYRIHQALGRAHARRGEIAAGIAAWEAALRLNPRQTEQQRRDYDSITIAIAGLKPR